MWNLCHIKRLYLLRNSCLCSVYFRCHQTVISERWFTACACAVLRQELPVVGESLASILCAYVPWSIVVVTLMSAVQTLFNVSILRGALPTVSLFGSFSTTRGSWPLTRAARCPLGRGRTRLEVDVVQESSGRGVPPRARVNWCDGLLSAPRADTLWSWSCNCRPCTTYARLPCRG